MKRLLTILALTTAFSATAQTSDVPGRSAKAVFFELGGPGLASFNYDMRFGKKEDGLGFRAGVGGFGIEGEHVLFFPVGLNYLLGKDGKNYFEIGAGITPVSTNAGLEGETFESTFGHLNFGYRLQPAKGGFFFRASINPVFGKGYFVPYYGGVSFGYKF